jgi:hypothetical protein
MEGACAGTLKPPNLTEGAADTWQSHSTSAVANYLSEKKKRLQAVNCLNHKKEQEKLVSAE